jgi:hypothetical protein
VHPPEGVAEVVIVGGVLAVDGVEQRFHQVGDDIGRADRAFVALATHDSDQEFVELGGDTLDSLVASDAGGELVTDIENRERGDDLRAVEVNDVIERAVAGIVGSEVVDNEYARP